MMKNLWRHSLVWLMLCLMAIVLFPSARAEAAKSVTGTCSYDYAYQVLNLINQQRKKAGAKAVKMDAELLDAAMLRAAECSVKFDHRRPNGTSCFSVNSKIYAENIAWGYKSPKAVVKAWMKSSGHKSNIVNKRYKSIGIGCFKKGGKWYWTQCFGIKKAQQEDNPGICKATYKVATKASQNTKRTKVEWQNPLSQKVSDFTATGGKRKLTLNWCVKGGITGYELQISTSKNYKTAQTLELGKNSTGKTIKKYNNSKLKAKKRYYVRIRAYIDSTDEEGNTTRQYNKWKSLNVKTK